MGMRNLVYKNFADIDISDDFFDSLKADYAEFPSWFARKATSGEKAYLYTQSGIQAFLYVKLEVGRVADISPPLPEGRHLKIGTLKINAHGTRLGQRFLKKIFDHALAEGADDIYVTAFEHHANLIRILRTYGFSDFAYKDTENGRELVLLKNLRESKRDILIDYPIVSRREAQTYLLAIYPEYHTQFLPDSKLNNESFDIVKDVSHANSIHKIYLSGIAATGKMNRGDILVMYRTTDIPGKAYYRSVATSICVVEEVRRINSFATELEFIRYVRPYSVFKTHELSGFYKSKQRHSIIKFTYNIALSKRIIRKQLLEEVGLPGSPRRWDFLKLTPGQFNQIVQMGEVNESYIVN